MPQAAEADDLTSGYGSFECRRFRQRIFSDLSPVALDLALRYAQTAERSSYVQANRKLLSIHERLLIHDLNLSGDTDELQQAAKRRATDCCHARQQAKTLEDAHLACLRIVERYRIVPPPVADGELEPAINRMCCFRWWFRKIRTLRLRTIEEIARNIELVSRGRSVYASDYTVRLKRKQKEKNRDYLASTFVSNECGESYSLQELADRSVATPAIRRAELMLRIKGFEMVAGLLDHAGEFYTLTTPSRMHACLHNGEPNPRHDGTTTPQAHEYLTHLWALIRAELYRQEIRPYGFRVVEPHHDGTPHWHLLLFMPAEQRNTVREVMRRHALADSGDEPGAQTHRFKAIASTRPRARRRAISPNTSPRTSTVTPWNAVGQSFAGRQHDIEHQSGPGAAVCIEYGVTHELCHLQYCDHDASFFRLLGWVMPDWETRKQRLETALL